MATQISHTPSENEATSGWSSLVSLVPKKEAAEKGEYTFKQTPKQPKLSPHSLEVCTESIGNETGGKSDGEDFLEPSKPRVYRAAKPRAMTVFPPPLPPGGARVERHQEDGRLVVMMVVDADASEGCFEAERENGRLKLWFKDMEENEVEDDDVLEMESESEEEDDGFNGEMVNVEAICVATA